MIVNAAPPVTVEVRPFLDQFSNCSSCRASARWMVDGTLTCDRHLTQWTRHAVDRAVAKLPAGVT